MASPQGAEVSHGGDRAVLLTPEGVEEIMVNDAPAHSFSWYEARRERIAAENDQRMK